MVGTRSYHWVRARTTPHWRRSREGADFLIYRDDPSSDPPGGVENPPKVLDLKSHNQNRPQAMTETCGKLVVGTVPAGDRLGGPLAVIDTKTRMTDVVIDNLITEESIVAADSRDGIVYGSTSVFGGLPPRHPHRPRRRCSRSTSTTGNCCGRPTPRRV